MENQHQVKIVITRKWSSIFKEKEEGDHKISLYFKKYRGTDDELCRIRFKSLKTHLMMDIYNYMARMFHFSIWWMQCMLCVFLALWQKSCFKLVGSKSKFIYKVGGKKYLLIDGRYSLSRHKKFIHLGIRNCHSAANKKENNRDHL